MSDDPLRLGGLGVVAIAEATKAKKMTKKAKDPIAAKNAETNAKREERMQAKLSEPPMAQVVQPPPPVQDKSALLDKIQSYRERFPNLKSRNKLSGKSSIEEIEDELHYCEQQLGQKDGHLGTTLFIFGMSALEESTKHYNPLGLNLAGLSAVARDNQEQFAPIIDELMIKYATNIYVGPEWRLAMVTATLVYTVHAANSGNPAMAQAMQSMASSMKPPEYAKDL